MDKAPYNDIASQWDIARTAFVSRERDYLDLLTAGLEPGSNVLDLGCGTGRPIAEYLIRKGHRVTGVDCAQALLEKARSRFPQARWQQARLEEFTIDEQYDAVVCWDALFHIQRTHHQRIITEIVNALPIGGRLMISTGGSSHPPFTDTMFGHRFFYDSHPPETALQIVRETGCGVLLAEFTNLPTGGRDKGKFAIVAEKKSSSEGLNAL